MENILKHLANQTCYSLDLSYQPNAFYIGGSHLGIYSTKEEQSFKQYVMSLVP
jgi:hypothetical protein